MLKIFYYLKRLIEQNILTYKALISAPLTQQEASQLRIGTHIILVEVLPYILPFDIDEDPFQQRNNRNQPIYKQHGTVQYVDPLTDMMTISIGAELIDLPLSSYNITWYVIRRIVRWD